MDKAYEITTRNGRRIVKGLGNFEPVPVYDLRELVKGSVKKYGSKTAFKFKRNGALAEKSYKDFDQAVDALGTALHSLGLKESKIAIISENRYEWAIAYFSIINGTGTGVPLDKYLPQNEVESLIKRSGASAIFYSASYQEMMETVSKKETTLKYFICMDELPQGLTDERFVIMEKLTEKGHELLDKDDRSFTAAYINRDEMSILFFTSGTTEASKGVMLSHANIAGNITSLTSIIKVYPNDVHLSLLPLHHTFENTIGLMFMLHMGITIAYSEGIRHLAQNIKEFKVTVLIGVPAIFDALYKRLSEGIEKSGKKDLVNVMTKVSGFLMKLGIDARRKIFKSVLNSLGPDLRLFASGAAPIDAEILYGIQRFGITFLQGYGLTETSPVVCATTFEHNNPGTVGRPVRDVEITIDNPDENGMGELLVKGQNIMLGYYENDEETKKVMNNGWLRTGDLGIIDERGILRITGRIKSMIVFTNGKKAFPEDYETLLNELPGVKDSFVWGHTAHNGGVEICAKIVLDRDYMDERNISTEKMGDELEAQIRKMNKKIPKYKILRYFVTTCEDLIKTTTLKIKRPLEMDKMKRYLDREGVEMRKLNKKFIDGKKK